MIDAVLVRPLRRRLGQRGVAATVVVLFLPSLLAGLALVVDAGVLLVCRAQLAAAADMGALAGAQDLDYELLAAGKVVIRSEQAVGDAEAYVRENLRGRPFIEADSVRVTVTVVNPAAADGSRQPACPVTGRALEAPTVCVVVRATVRLPLLPGKAAVTVRVHADAGVVGRPG